MECQPCEDRGGLTADAAIEQLEAQVQNRLGGHLRDFRVRKFAQGLVLQGFARTYYAKQLAQHAVMEASPLSIIANEIEVA